jgi:hypothetical protein
MNELSAFSQALTAKFWLRADGFLLHRNSNVCTATGDNVCHAAGSGPHALEHWAAIHPGVLHDQATDVRSPQIFGVAERALDKLLEHAGASLGLVTQNCKRIVDRFAAYQIGKRTDLAGTDPSVSVYCCVCHDSALSR